MRLQYIYIMLALVVACSSTPKGDAEGKSAPQFVTTNPLVHDPVMAFENGRYYLFCTGRGISCMSSPDLKNWSFEGQCIDSLPAWLKAELPAAKNHLWAPDIVFANGKWHLFYSCSAFGKNTSVIGHVTSETLASAKWVDEGMIVKSVPYRDMWNAIDPNVIRDEEGTWWMVFGSFWDGIMLTRLNDDLSGMSSPEVWKRVARRHRSESYSPANAGDGAIEAPFVFKHGEWYYLFVSVDYCCRGKDSTYKIVVGRSNSVTGPYLDNNGVDLVNGGGTIVLEGDKVDWQAVGHCAAYTFDGRDVLLAHAYSMTDGSSHLVIRDINWNDGWPVVKW